VHRFTAAGQHMLSFGESGTDTGQFYCPHNIVMHPDGGAVLVADRENSRISVWSVDGEPLHNWPAGHRPAGICVGKGPSEGLLFVAEQGNRMSFAGYTDWDRLDTWSPNIGCRVSILDLRTGEIVQRLGGATPGEGPGHFISLHSIAVDSVGDIYCAEVSNVDVGQHMNPPRELMSLRKWRRVQE
jgi:hypothetical protein